MGYELDKLKNLYGVSSATSTYGGTAMPVKPVDPTGTEAYKKLDNAKQSAARAAYQNQMASYTSNLPKYQEDKALYDKYQQAYKQRMLNTNMYDPAAKRQVLQQPIYSNANPDLVSQDKQFTISKMPETKEELPNLVSKYFNPASSTTAPSTNTPPAASATLNQAQAWEKYQKDLREQQLIAARNAVNNPVGTIEGNKTQSHYYMLTSRDPRGSNYTNYYDPSNLQSDEALTQNVINSDAKLNPNSRLLQQYSSTLKDWTDKNPFGSGAYAFAAKGGHIDLNSLAQKYADGGPVKATADMYKAWNEDPDKAAADAAMQKGDYTTAASLLQKSAASGNANAQANLGAFYAHGLGGLPRDDVEAAKLMLIANKNGYGNIDKNSNYYWLTQKMSPEQIKSAKQGADDFFDPEGAKQRASAAAIAAEKERLFQQPAANQQAPIGNIQASQAAAAETMSNERAAESAAAKAREAENAAAVAAEKQRLFTAAQPLQEAVSTVAAPKPATSTDIKTPEGPVYNLGEGPAPVVTDAVSAAPKPDDAAVAAIKNLDTGTMDNAPRLGGTTMAPAGPAPNLGATPPPPAQTAVGNAPANDAVVQAVKSMPSQTMVAPAAPTNSLANLYQSYQQQSTGSASQSAQQKWQADRNNYIRSLYGLGTYTPDAIAEWEKNNVLGQGKYHYATGGAVKTHYPNGGEVDLSSDDTEDTTSTTVEPDAYDALLAKYKDVDADAIARARADYRAKQQAIVDQMANYAAAQKAEKPDKSEMYFRLAQAFLTPGKTGSFGEGLANAGGVMADYQKDLRAQRRADAAAQLQLGMKQNELLANMSQEDLQSLEARQAKVDAARQAIELAKIKASGTPTSSISEYAKVALALGLKQGTPEFQAKVQELWNEAHRPPVSASGNLYSEDAVTDLARRYIAGDASALTGLGRSTGAMARIQNKVSELLRDSGASPQDITAAQQNLKSQQRLLQNFSSSTPSSQGGQVLAMNTLVGHVNTLTKAAEALQRGDVALFNSLKTMWQEQTNQPLPNNLGLISQLVGDELQKAAVGGAGGVEERKDLKAKLYSPGANYNVIKEAADYANHLAAQRIKSLKQQWTAVKLPEEQFNDYLTEDTKELLRAHTSTLTTKQQQAIDWLKKNPNDPQAAAVRATLAKQGVTF